MKIELWAIGKTNEKYLTEGISIYEKRLKHYCNFELCILPDVKVNANTDALTVKKKEAEVFLKKLQPNDYLILLDEHGKNFSSIQFSAKIDQLQINATKSVVFLIGGAFGFDEKIHEIAKEKLSLSAMTFSHQMIRLFFVEQLYRAYTIIRGESYHNE